MHHYCHYWYFGDKDIYLCNGCQNLMEKAMNFNDVAIVSVKESNYRIHFWYTSKDDAINIMKNTDLKKKMDYYRFFSLYIKMSKTNYYEMNRETVLNRVKDYYENNKEVLREKARNKYRELPEEEKNTKKEYGRNRYHNIPEEKKQTLKEYQKIYLEANKSKKS